MNQKQYIMLTGLAILTLAFGTTALLFRIIISISPALAKLVDDVAIYERSFSDHESPVAFVRFLGKTNFGRFVWRVFATNLLGFIITYVVVLFIAASTSPIWGIGLFFYKLLQI